MINIKIPGELSSATILRVRFRGLNSENANDFDDVECCTVEGIGLVGRVSSGTRTVPDPL